MKVVLLYTLRTTKAATRRVLLRLKSQAFKNYGLCVSSGYMVCIVWGSLQSDEYVSCTLSILDCSNKKYFGPKSYNADILWQSVILIGFSGAITSATREHDKMFPHNRPG